MGWMRILSPPNCGPGGVQNVTCNTNFNESSFLANASPKLCAQFQLNLQRKYFPLINKRKYQNINYLSYPQYTMYRNVTMRKKQPPPVANPAIQESSETPIITPNSVAMWSTMMQRTTENCNCGSIHWRAKPFISSGEYNKIILWLSIT